MAHTVQQVIDKARYVLNDADKVRYPDAECLDYLNDAVYVVRKKRPDMFIGQWLGMPGGLSLASTFPLMDEYVPAVQGYIVARCEFKDDEHANSGRATGFMALFEQGVLSV